MLSGVSIMRGGIKLSHLFFAGDFLLFCKENVVEWSRVQEMLVVYEKALVHKVNIENIYILVGILNKKLENIFYV